MNFSLWKKQLLILSGCLILNTPVWANNPNLNVKGAVGLRYDDNINYSADHEMSDLITRLSLGLQYLLEQKTQSLEASIEVHQDLFSDHDEFNNSSQNLDIVFNKELSKFERFNIQETFRHSEEATSFEDEFGRENGRFDTYKNNLFFEFNKDLTPDNILNLSYENEVKEVSRDDLKDSIINRLDGELTHAWSAKTSGFLKYQFTHIYVDDPDNAFIQTLAPGLKYFLTKQLQFKTYAGANIIHTFDQHDLVRPTFFASLTDELDKRSMFTLSYKKDFMPTGYSADILDQWRVSMRFDRQLYERLWGFADLFYGQGDFVIRDITEKLTGINVGFRYNLTDNWETNVSFQHMNKDSDTPSREYKKNTVYFGFAFKF